MKVIAVRSAEEAVKAGAKVSRQGEVLRWPVVFAADGLDEGELAHALDFCLIKEAKNLALECRNGARRVLVEAHKEFAALFTLEEG